MEPKRVLIVGAGRRHNAPLIAALSAVGLDVTVLARPGDAVRDDEREANVRVHRFDPACLESLITHVVGDGLRPPCLMICDAGFAHDELTDAHELARIDRRIAEIQAGVMAVACASVALAWRPNGLLVFLGFVSDFRNHAGYRRFARGARAGLDVAQALALQDAGFRTAYIGLDGEDPLTDHPNLGPFILKLWRSPSISSRWLFETEDLDSPFSEN
jgi:hypothetical protein